MFCHSRSVSGRTWTVRLLLYCVAKMYDMANLYWTFGVVRLTETGNIFEQCCCSWTYRSVSGFRVSSIHLRHYNLVTFCHSFFVKSLILNCFVLFIYLYFLSQFHGCYSGYLFNSFSGRKRNTHFVQFISWAIHQTANFRESKLWFQFLNCFGVYKPYAFFSLCLGGRIFHVICLLILVLWTCVLLWGRGLFLS